MTATRVEFVGPPAVGKTTLARAVGDHLTDRLDAPISVPTDTVASRGTARRILTKLGYALWRFFRAPGRSLADLRAISRTDQQTPGDTLSVALNWQYVCAISGRASGLVLLDQGLYQALWSVGYRSGRPWNESLRCLTVPESLRPDFVVVVRADRETVAQRLHNREGDSRVDSSTLDHAIAGIDRLETVLDEHGTPTVAVETTTDEAFEVAVDSVAERILESCE